jgi:hypothetical protein
MSTFATIVVLFGRAGFAFQLLGYNLSCGAQHDGDMIFTAQREKEKFLNISYSQIIPSARIEDYMSNVQSPHIIRIQTTFVGISLPLPCHGFALDSELLGEKKKE